MARTAQPDLVLGVAGHIDHGKTALVKALTGTDTDRLPEEKSRGITIELGFAQRALSDGRRAAVIDMPGHERFVRAMIAGAGGVDLLLLVVASNEGVMPQTREHLAVASLLGVRGGVVALSKADLAKDAPELLALAVDEVRETLRGSVLEGAEIVAVSAHDGTGLEALLGAIERAAVAPRSSDGPALLPVDRVFVRKGFGAVVTGTLVSGVLREGDELLVGPLEGVDDALRPVRVRGLQVYGEGVREARAGTRLAVNLAGVEASDLSRGMWLVRPGELGVTRAFDAQVRWLESARAPMRRRARLELLVGAAHTVATVALLEGECLEPGREALVRVTTERPVVLRPGERFVLRGPPSLAGYGSTVGGGSVVRPRAERAKRAVALERAEAALEQLDAPAERARQEGDAAGLRGLSAQELRVRSGYDLAGGDRARVDSAGLFAVERDRFVSRAVLDECARRVLGALSAFHAANASLRGIEPRELEASARLDHALFDAVVQTLVREKKLSREGELLARQGFRPRDLDALPHLRAVAAALEKGGVMPPRVQDIAAEQKVSPAALEPALKRLVERGDVVRVSAEFYADARAMRALEARLRAWLAEKGTIDAQGFKELTGATRKWSVPLSEYFDAKKVTIRVGDLRKLRG